MNIYQVMGKDFENRRAQDNTKTSIITIMIKHKWKSILAKISFNPVQYYARMTQDDQR